MLLSNVLSIEYKNSNVLVLGFNHTVSSLQHNTDSTFRGYDHNVLPVWGQGVTGKNVVVSILDDGKFYFTV